MGVAESADTCVIWITRRLQISHAFSGTWSCLRAQASGTVSFSGQVLFPSHLLCLQHFLLFPPSRQVFGRLGNQPVKGRS
jgi:hypothetical protein